MNHWLLAGILLAIQLGVMLRVLLLPDRSPNARAAWLLAVGLLPGPGTLLYLLLGEPWFAPRLGEKRRIDDTAFDDLANASVADSHAPLDHMPDRFHPPFAFCAAISRMPPVRGNRATLAKDSDDAIDMMIADINAARSTVHLSFYIWLPDTNGKRMTDAVAAAARRGVTCRVIVDDIGSRLFIASPCWAELAAAGVQQCRSMAINPLAGFRRADLRNHRKIAVIDDQITYCGSQNCADAAFEIKPKFAPWVDVMMRLDGPIVIQNQALFAADWLAERGENLGHIFTDSKPVAYADGFDAVAFGTGPLSVRGSMSQAFIALINAALDEVVITTPYFAPDSPLLAALVACGRRGVKTTMILPARNDSRLIALISRAYYGQLQDAGVEIHEFLPGLLHAKTLVVDGATAMVGSSNMDRRSLELNFENNILFHDPRAVGVLSERQQSYLAQSRLVSPAEIAARPARRRALENLATLLSPIF